MSSSIQMQSSRFELKYLVQEDQVVGIRRFLYGHLVPDPHADPKSGYCYPVHSLYMDNPGLVLYRGTTEGLKNRFKLRIRFYDDNPGHPAFLEIKRRIGQVVRKERAAVSRWGADRLLGGKSIGPDCLNEARPAAVMALSQFCGLVRQIDAGGCVYVSYIREAYVSPDSDQIRVTFDRQLVASRYCAGKPLSIPKSSVPARADGVLLELKFTDRFPRWMHDLVRTFDLWRVSFAKYVQCVKAIGLTGEVTAFRKAQ